MVLAAADMKNMYPATNRVKIETNLATAKQMHHFCGDQAYSDKIYAFIIDALVFATKHSLLTINEGRIALQIYELL